MMFYPKHVSINKYEHRMVHQSDILIAVSIYHTSE